MNFHYFPVQSRRLPCHKTGGIVVGTGDFARMTRRPMIQAVDGPASDDSSMMHRSMALSDSTPDAPGDYSRRAGLCVEILGWLTLLRLDLLGFVLIKAG